ncbi:hypothetical protein AYI68_g5832 [Smittium mucronatum]|uniref:Uncharacterized protein n=1 Tax=Smittium mucronatum TaxID=133383 RepID=A0A1R0GT57_9FUNG|nr:hypothetical protein AYI68_g5832 [Smittium mucronatum]
MVGNSILSEADFLYQLDWYNYSLLNCFCAAKEETTLSDLLSTHYASSSSRDFRTGIAPLLRLSTLRPLLSVLTTLSVFTAPTVDIIGEILIGGLGPEPNVSPNKEYTRSSITSSPVKLNDGSKSYLNSRTSI